MAFTLTKMFLDLKLKAITSPGTANQIYRNSMFKWLTYPYGKLISQLLGNNPVFEKPRQSLSCYFLLLLNRPLQRQDTF